MAAQVLITSSSSENKHGQIGFLQAAAAAVGILSLTATCGARGFAYWLVCLCCCRLAKYCSRLLFSRDCEDKMIYKKNRK